MGNELISVVMSSHDTPSEYFLLAVKSILSQTYDNLELIVVIDGGEYDDCLSGIVDKRLKLIKHERTLGLAVRLNEGFSIAKGKYIARMDSDDYALPDRLKKQYNFMKRHQEVDICGMFARKFGDSNTFMVNPCVDDGSIKAELIINNILIHPTMMFRAESIKSHSIKYDESYTCAQDYELWSRLLGECTFAVISEVGLFYRKHNKQVSVDRRREQLWYNQSIVAKNLDRMGMSEKNLRYVDMLNNKKHIEDVTEMINFVNRCLEKSRENKICKERDLKKVLFRHAFTILLKRWNFIDSIKFLQLYNLNYLIKKRMMILRCRLQVIKYRTLYKRCMDGESI